MHESIPRTNIPPPWGNPRDFAKVPNQAGRDLYKPKFLGVGFLSKFFVWGEWHIFAKSSHLGDRELIM